MRFRNLLATVLVPIVLAVAALGIAPGTAAALPRCASLESDYLRYEALASTYMGRWRDYHVYQDLWMGEEYEERRIQTAQIIMESC